MARAGIRTAVVGAGLAGLAAAWRLRRAGCQVALLERSARPGGRFAGERIESFAIDRALHVMRSSDARVQAWIREVGLADELLPLRPLTTRQLHRGRIRPYSTRSVREIMRLDGVRRLQGARVLRLPRLMRRYAHLLDPEAPERAADWDYRSVADFARLYFGRSVLEHFVGPLATSATLGDARDLSRVAFLHEWLAEQGGRIGIARRGLQELPVAAAEQLGVRPGVEVERIEARGAGGFALFTHGAGELAVDAVVLATSAGEAARVAGQELRTPERAFLAERAYGAEITLVAALDRVPGASAQYLRVPHGEGEIIESALLEPGVADGRAPNECGLATLAANQRFCESSAGAPDEVVEKEMLATLERICPSSVGTVRFTRLFRRAQGVPRFDVGTYRALDGFERVQRDRRALGRRLYFTGDYLCGLGAEAILRNAERAARALLEDFGPR